MKIQDIYNKIHKRAPRLGKLASFTTAAGVISATSFTYGGPLWVAGMAKIISGADIANDTVISIAKSWININNKLIDSILPERDWRIDLPGDLDEDKQYLLISNHQSWVDTSIVQYISQDTLPLTRFFTKFNLIYIPIIGQAFYFLDFPMMKRHTKEQVAKNPALKDRDIMEAKRACETLKDKPFALLNYLEGTRFNEEKRREQNSPYKNLLKPKGGGLSLALRALGDQIDGVLDMTVVYPDGAPAYDDLWKGEVRRLSVHMRHLEVPEDLKAKLRDETQEDAAKAQVYSWIDKIWQEKDARIDQMLAEFDD